MRADRIGLGEGRKEVSMDGLDLLSTRRHDPVTAGGLNLTLHTALFVIPAKAGTQSLPLA